MKDFKHFGFKFKGISSCNYTAIWSNLTTVRFGDKEIKELPADKAEFYDVSLGNRCHTGKCNFCLVPETHILTNEGDKYITDIKTEDLVFSYNECSGDIELKKVDQVFERVYEGELIEVVTEIGTLRLTPNHKIYTRNRGWIEACNLQVSDELLEF